MKRFAPLLFCGLLLPLLTAATGYQVNYGANQDITEWSTCKNVSNNSPSGKAIFVPTKTSAEWSAFYNASTPGITVSACAAPCAGTSYGGFCWYLSASAASCTSTCSSHGGTVDGGTINYVGSGGSLQNCTDVATAMALNPVSSVDNTTVSSKVGCLLSTLYTPSKTNKITRYTKIATTQAETGAISEFRICSCVK